MKARHNNVCMVTGAQKSCRAELLSIIINEFLRTLRTLTLDRLLGDVQWIESAKLGKPSLQKKF